MALPVAAAMAVGSGGEAEHHADHLRHGDSGARTPGVSAKKHRYSPSTAEHPPRSNYPVGIGFPVRANITGTSLGCSMQR